MAKSCCEVPKQVSSDHSSFKKALWIALILNFGMFVLEATASFKAESVSLLADAVDFLGDAGNYAISLIVLPLAFRWHSRAAFFKGATMLFYGLFVFGRAIYLVIHGSEPEAYTMGFVGVLALAVNFSVAYMLYKYRTGDANQKSVWLCSRNDAIGNAAVIGAAFLVSWSSKSWPDLAVAFFMAWLAAKSGYEVLLDSYRELKRGESQGPDQSADKLGRNFL